MSRILFSDSVHQRLCKHESFCNNPMYPAACTETYDEHVPTTEMKTEEKKNKFVSL